MRKWFSRAMMKERLGRFAPYFAVMVLFSLFLKLVYFFSLKAVAGSFEVYFVSRNNSMLSESVFSLLFPAVWCSLMLAVFRRNESDVLHSLPVSRTQRAGTCFGILLLVQSAMQLLSFITDAILGRWAADGFAPKGFLLHKNVLLLLMFLCAVGVVLLAFAASGTFWEYILYLSGMSVLVILTLELAIYYVMEELRGLTLPQSNAAAECRSLHLGVVLQRNALISDWDSGKEYGTVYLILIPMALLLLTAGMAAFRRRPAEWTEKMHHCGWIRVIFQTALIPLCGIGPAWRLAYLLRYGAKNERLAQLRVMLPRLFVILVAFVIWEYIAYRSVKKTKRALMGFLLGMLILVALYFLLKENAVNSYESWRRVKEARELLYE